MTPKTRTALLQTIEHWERLKDGISPVADVDHCPLCQLFFDYYCTGCPVSQHTKEYNCQGSPYYETLDLTVPQPVSPVSPEWEKAAQAEIDFLRGLLT